MDIEQQKQYLVDVFNYYRKQGFPYYPTTKEYRDYEFNKLQKFNRSNIIKNKIITQTMHGLGLAWSYFPHSFEVKCNKMRTPMENFIDDEKLKKVIQKRMRLGDNMSDSGLRKMLRMYTGSQGVSNFRPTAASAIYDTYMKKGQTTWDICAGYGGRLLGAIISEINYIGTDPDVKTYLGLKKLAQDYGKNIDITIVNKGCETWHPDKVDFVFSSPPYFDTERYSEDVGQSCIKYPVLKDWINNFIGQTARNIHACLDGDLCAINICNTKTAPNLENETIRIFEENDFKFYDEIKLALSRYKIGNDATYKYEPIFVFKKRI